MKSTNILLLLIFSLTASFSANAQSLVIENASVNYEDQTIPAVKVVMSPTPKKVKEEFKDYIKDRYDVKMKGIGFLTNKDVLTAEGVQIPKITSKNMDLSAKVVERGDDTEMYVFGKLGYDINLSPDNDYRTEYRAMKSITVDFLNTFLPNYYQDRVDETQDMLGDLRDDRKDLKDDISDNENKIKELEKENKELASDLENTKTKIIETEEKLNIRKNSLQSVNKELKKAGDK